MNPAIKAEWIAALRDGSYKQAKYMMRDLDDHFDVIGVLVDRAVAAGVQPEPVRYDKKGGMFFGYRYGDSATRIPPAVSEWAGIGYWEANHLQTLNDEGHTFSQLADRIEAEL